MVNPNIRQGDPPRFDQLDEFAFQDMCCALFDTKSSIAMCSVYGRRGESQEGIDLFSS